MKNNLLYGILGFNLGVIGTVLYFIMSSQESGLSLLNYVAALGVGILLGGIGYFVGGQMA